MMIRMYVSFVLEMKMPPTVSEANAFLALGDELEEMGENLRGLSTSDSDEFTSLKTPIAVQVIASEYYIFLIGHLYQ
jgi:hypothetical protein